MPDTWVYAPLAIQAATEPQPSPSSTQSASDPAACPENFRLLTIGLAVDSSKKLAHSRPPVIIAGAIGLYVEFV